MSEFFTWLANGSPSAIVFMVVVIIIVIGLILLAIFAFIQGRPITLGKLSIGEKPNEKKDSKTSDTGPVTANRESRTQVNTEKRQLHLINQKERLLRATDNIIESVPKDNPIVGFLTGWYEQLANELETGGSHSFEIDASYYESCLAYFHENDQIKAVADLSTVEVEGFWSSNPNPQRTAVKERIFFISQETFFDRNLLSHYHRVFHRHSQSSERIQIYVKRIPTGSILKEEIFRDERYFPNATTWNMLLIEPDVVGMYVTKDDRTLLRIVRDKNVFNRANSHYELLKKRSVKFNDVWSDLDLKKAWIRHEKIGHWRENWGDAVEDRSIDYFDKYDMHIRLWVPYYRKLIDLCTSTTKMAIRDRMRETSDNIKVLEVGFGTGALTQAILEWIESIDEPLNVGHFIPLIRFFGVDRAYGLMFPLLQQRIKGIDEVRYNISLSEGSFWNALPHSILNAKPFDIVCGSLVLHDLIAADSLKKFKEMLKICHNFLTPGGRLIFADIFPHNDPAEQEKEKAFWSNWMRRNGLPEREIDSFFRHNSDMLNTVNRDQVALVAAENGYDFQFEHPYTVNRYSPFRVLMLTKI